MPYSCGMTDAHDKPVTGRCLCGDIRYEYRGAPIETLHCHCESCRRHASAPITTFVCVPAESFRYISGTPVAYASSPGVTRTHCGRCGSPISYTSNRSAQVDLYIGTLDDPMAAVPTCHVHVAEQLPWFETADALPRYDRGKPDGPPSRHGPRKD
jgi:hypothetical protein